MKLTHTLRTAGLTVAIAVGVSMTAGTAVAQMFEQPYSFQSRDRAGLAVYMKNLQESRSDNGTVAGGGDATYLVCGGPGGGATSTANSSCIILNNSDAALGIGQDSDGDQNSDSNVETTETTTTADEVSNILNQNQ